MKWLEVKAIADVGEVYIYGEITDLKWFDEEVTPSGVKDELDKLKNVSSINVYVNSPGGNIFAGVAIYNALKRVNVPVTAYVDGIAASIASLIVLAADRVVMPFNAMLMIHNAWMIAAGDYNEFRTLADKLEKIQDSVLIETYSRKTGMSKEKLAAMMDEETWLSGEEAVKMGFADEVIEEQKIAACYSGENIKFSNVEVQLDRFRAFPKAKFKEHIPKNNKSLEQRHRHITNMLTA